MQSNIRKLPLLMGLCFLLIAPGCMTTEIGGLYMDVVKDMPTWKLCQDYHNLTQRKFAKIHIQGGRLMQAGIQPEALKQLEDELSLRLTAREMEAARNRKVFIGMSQNAMYAVMGTPRRENRTVGVWGTRIQHVYGDFGPYFYTENGVLTTWQD